MATIVGRKKKGATLPIVISTSPRGNNPQCIVLPIVTGTATIGSTVTVSQGTWLNNPGTFYYQWQRNLSDIPGAVFTNYVLQSADLNQSITCLVTAWNINGNGIARTVPFIPIAGGGSAAILTLPTSSATSSSTATLGVTTDTGTGTLYWVVSTVSTVPSAVQIIAGNDSTGSAAAKAGFQSVSATGAQSVAATGLSATTTYFAFFVQVSGLNSNVVGSASFTTASMAAPTLAIQSALGAAPLTLEWSDTDYIAGDYAQLEIDQTSSAFSHITQNIIFFIDGASWALNDEAIGLVTPSGTYWARIRVCRENESGTLVTGLDPLGNALSFNADVSSWSNVVNDTISASVAALNTTTGTGKSSLITVSGTPALTFAGANGNGNTAVRTTVQQASNKAQFEVTFVSGTASTCDFGVGIDNGTDNLNTGGVYPGYSTNNGIEVEFLNAGQISVNWNSRANQVILINTAGTIAVGDIFTIVYDKGNNTLEVWRTRSGTTTQMGTTQSGLPALTSQFAFGGTHNQTDTCTFNFGGSAYAKTPGTGVATIWA